MSSVPPQRVFSNGKLHPVKETFTAFGEILVKSEEEMGGQFRLLDFTRTPRIILHRIDFLQNEAVKKEDLADQLLRYQRMDSSLKLVVEEKQEHHQIKEEQEDLYICQNVEQPVLQQETDIFMRTFTNEEEVENEPGLNVSQLISQEPPVAEIQDYENSGSKRDWMQKRRTQKSRDQNSHPISCTQKGCKSSPQNIEMHSCTVCDKHFSCFSLLTQHMKVHTGGEHLPCLICDNLKARRGEKLLSCEICGKCFGLKSSLACHMRAHASKKSFSCDVCGKWFSLKSSLIIHRKSYVCLDTFRNKVAPRNHTGAKPFLCTLCEKRFTQKGSLTVHMKLHTGDLPFSCMTCGKRFSRKHSLTSHMRSHTGEKPYSCDICGNRFTQKGSLNYHLRTHTGERPFLCITCGKCFSRKQQLKRHMNSHGCQKPVDL